MSGVATHTRGQQVQRRSTARLAALIASALATGLPQAGCAFAVDHPAITAGTVGGAIGLGTCRLASDDNLACLGVGGAAGAFLGLIAATALWLGGDGHSVLIEEQAQPLPDDGRPIKRHRPPAQTDEPVPAPAAPAPTAPAPAAPAPTGPAPTPAAPTPAASISASMLPATAAPAPPVPR